MAHPTERYLLFFVANFCISKSKPRKLLDIKNALTNISKACDKGMPFRYEVPTKKGQTIRYMLCLKDVDITTYPDKAFILLSACDREDEQILIDENTSTSRLVDRKQGEVFGHEVLFSIKFNKGSGGYICILEQAKILSKTNVSAALQYFFRTYHQADASFYLSPLSNMKLLEEATKGKLTTVELSKKEISIDELSKTSDFKPKKQTLSLSVPPTLMKVTQDVLGKAFERMFNRKEITQEKFTNLKIGYLDDDKKTHTKTFEFDGKDLLQEAVQRKEMISFSTALNLTPKKIKDLNQLATKISQKLDEN